MKTNLILKILSSIPIILLAIYIYPFFGICLIILRYFLYKQKRISTPILIITIGILLLIPKYLFIILKKLNITNNIITYLQKIINLEIYNINIIKYSKDLLIIGAITLIITIILEKIINKINRVINSSMLSYINKSIENEKEISKQNDLEIKLKQEKTKTTAYIKCQNCGSDNLINEKIGVCKYCRSKLENKNYPK